MYWSQNVVWLIFKLFLKLKYHDLLLIVLYSRPKVHENFRKLGLQIALHYQILVFGKAKGGRH